MKIKYIIRIASPQNEIFCKKKKIAIFIKNVNINNALLTAIKITD